MKTAFTQAKSNKIRNDVKCFKNSTASNTRATFLVEN